MIAALVDLRWVSPAVHHALVENAVVNSSTFAKGAHVHVENGDLGAWQAV